MTKVKIGPLAGVWYEPFIAYPLSEKDQVNGSFFTDSRIAMGLSKSSGTLKADTGLLDVYIISFANEVNPVSQGVFSFFKAPSVLYFGDIRQPKLQYWVKKPRK